MGYKYSFVFFLTFYTQSILLLITYINTICINIVFYYYLCFLSGQIFV